MPALSNTLYKNLAEDYDNLRSTMLSVDDSALIAVNRIVNLTTATTGALTLELDLLSPLNTTYAAVLNTMTSTASLLPAVRAINNNIINNAATGTGDPLTNLVNSLWDCVPIYWTALSADAGYDTTDWNVCS